MSETSPVPWRWVPAGFATGEIRDEDGVLVAAGVAKRDGVLLAAAPDLRAVLRRALAVLLLGGAASDTVREAVVDLCVTVLAKVDP
jgi:hypothetical protein